MFTLILLLMVQALLEEFCKVDVLPEGFLYFTSFKL